MSILIYTFLASIIVITMLLSYFLGEKSYGEHKESIYESGIKTANYYSCYVNYFFLGILFVIFDIESAFIYLWSQSIKDLSWDGFYKMSFFIFILILSILYANSIGVFYLVKSKKSNT